MLDTSIAMSGRGVTLPDLGGDLIKGYQAGQSLKDAAQMRQVRGQEMEVRAQQLGALKLQSAEDARLAHEAQTLRGLSQINDTSTPEGQAQFLHDLQGPKVGLGHLVSKFQTQFQDQRKAAQAAKKLEFLDRIDLHSRLISGVNSEESLQIAKNRLQKMGEEIDDLPEHYDEAAIQEYLNSATSYKDQLERSDKQQTAKDKIDADARALGVETQKFNETKRHNAAMEGVAQTNANTNAGKSNVANGAGIVIPGLVPMPDVQITKESVKAVKTGAQAYDTVKDQIKRMRDLYKQTGTEMGGEKARKLASMVRQIQLTLKGPEFLQLGVLAGPDMALLDEMVPNPTGWKDNFKSMVPGLGDPITPKLDELENFIDGRYKSALKRNGFDVAPSAVVPGKATPNAGPVIKWGRDANGNPVQL